MGAVSGHVVPDCFGSSLIKKMCDRLTAGHTFICGVSNAQISLEVRPSADSLNASPIRIDLQAGSDPGSYDGEGSGLAPSGGIDHGDAPNASVVTRLTHRATRAARVSVAGPFLALNYAPGTSAVLSGRMVTWTLTARNSGALAAPVTLTLNVPFDQTWIDGSLQWNTGLLINRGDRLGWIGRLGIGEALTVTYRMTTPWTLKPVWLYGSATAAADQEVQQAGGYVEVSPFRAYLPVVRNSL